MENNRVLTDRIGKRGNHLHSIRKSADLCLEEKSAWVISIYEQKSLTGLVSPKVKMADRDRNIEGIVLQV
jgi:hypothetical protein